MRRRGYSGEISSSGYIPSIFANANPRSSDSPGMRGRGSPSSHRRRDQSFRNSRSSSGGVGANGVGDAYDNDERSIAEDNIRRRRTAFKSPWSQHGRQAMDHEFHRKSSSNSFHQSRRDDDTFADRSAIMGDDDLPNCSMLADNDDAFTGIDAQGNTSKVLSPLTDKDHLGGTPFVMRTAGEEMLNMDHKNRHLTPYATGQSSTSIAFEGGSKQARSLARMFYFFKFEFIFVRNFVPNKFKFFFLIFFQNTCGLINGRAPDESWITVFGFAPGNLSVVMREMEKHGKIDDYMVGGGNWAHIKFQTATQAAEALCQNGNRITSSIMIGVVPCTEQGLRKLSSSDEQRRPDAAGTGMTPSRQRLNRSYNRRYSLNYLGKKNMEGATLSTTRGDGPGGLNIGASLRWDGRHRAPLMKRDTVCNRLMKWAFNV